MEESFNQEMKLFVPIDIAKSIEKSNESGEDGDWYIAGYASTPTLDLQGEIVQPSGIDIGYFVENGWINYEHKNDAEYIIGAPTQKCYVDFNKGLYVEAKLMKNNKWAKDMWDLANSIQKSGIDRKLGFSIEGGIRRRNSNNNKIIEEMVVSNIALTTHPANTEATWEVFMKSWETGHGITPETQVNAGALRKEELARALNTLTYLYKIDNLQESHDVWKGIGEYLDGAERTSPETAVIMLQLARGISRKEAENFVNNRKETKD